MVNANNIAACMVIVWVPVCGRNDQVPPPWRSLFGRKINKADQIRVQAARINRLEQRIQKLSDEGAFLIERGQQHREMRVKGNRELREKIEELNLKLLNQHEDMHKDFEHKLVAVREEMWSQAERDRAALENELGLRHEADRERIMEEANQRADEVIEVAKAKMVTEAERDRELYAQRAALAEEGQELAREDRKQLQMEKEELERKLQETIDMEDRFRRKIILKFKARENTLRQNFEAQLREARAEAVGGAAKRSKTVTPDMPPASTSSSAMEGSQRVTMKSSTTIPSGVGGGVPSNTGTATTPQR